MQKKRDKKTASLLLNGADYKKARSLNDSDLVEMIIDGNPRAYREIEKRYEKKLASYIYRLVGNREEAEDVLQNVFIKVYNNIEKYDMKRKFSSWIYRIAHNEAVNFLKKKTRKKLVSWEDVVSTEDQLKANDDLPSPNDLWIKKEINKEVRDALKKLPPKYRQILVMRYDEEKSYLEIGKVLGKPVNTVGTLISRAKNKLFEVMKK